MPLATVLYEDKMQIGSGKTFPAHDLILAMIADLTGQSVYSLRVIIEKNPRNGINKLIGDLSRTALLAGTGTLFILVDRDRIAEHIGLPKVASEEEVTARLLQRSDAPGRLSVHYLYPNMEGLLRSISGCDPSVPAPLTKDHNSRDIYLNRAAFAVPASVRDCVKGGQPGLSSLVQKLAERCRDTGR